MSDTGEPIKIEPPASMRSTALMFRQYYLAMVEAGFSEDQALELTKQFMACITRRWQ